MRCLSSDCRAQIIYNIFLMYKERAKGVRDIRTHTRGIIAAF